MTLRRATVKDIPEIQALINYYAGKDKMLPRSLNELYENIRDFWVKEEEGVIIGCAALHVIWEDLAEVKSLAIKEGFTKHGIGKSLLDKCIGDARALGIKQVFALTYVPDYFKKFGFKEILKEKLPHKIWSECIRCPKFPGCSEIALLYKVESRGNYPFSCYSK